jgi:predicted secreted protein
MPIIVGKGNSMLLKKTLIISVIFLTCVSGLWAGDSAVFVDLGFSPDGRFYTFGQHGVLSPSLRPWAEIFVVDVQRNNFVPNGRVSFTQDAPIRAGQDGSGILHQLLSSNTSLTSRHNINFQNQGLPLYISRDENPPRNGETIEFRDFLSGKSYRARLVPTVTGSGMNVSSRFQIELAVTSPNGQVRNYTVGTPHFVRQRIAQYNIKRVLIDTTGNSVIFVIEMRRIAENGVDIRYMVEAVRL